MDKTQKRVFISRQIPSIANKILSEAGFEIHQWSIDRSMTAEELMKHTENSDALLCTSSDRIDEQFLARNPNLKIVSTFGVGYDHIDTTTAKALKIKIGNTPGVLTEATAEIAFLLMVAVARRMKTAQNSIVNNTWKDFNPLSLLGKDLRNKTLGIFGMGAIGREMARRCSAVYHMEIIYHNRNRNETAENELNANYVSFDDLIQRSDVLSVHASLNDSTRDLFDYEIFRRMKKDSIFINTSRGGLHNESDLLNAIRAGHLWGVGLDVTNPEPMDPHHPLLELENVIVLPHIGSATEFTRNEMARLAAENIVQFFASGKIPHMVV